MKYMKYKKTTAILLSAALILSCLAGCGRRNTPAAPGSQTDTGSQTQNSAGNREEPENKPSEGSAGENGPELQNARLMGKVSAIDGQTVTFEVFLLPHGAGGSMGGPGDGQRPDDQNSQPPTPPDGQNNQQPPEPPSGENGGQPPEPPSGENGQQPGAPDAAGSATPQNGDGRQGQDGPRGGDDRGGFPGGKGQATTLTLTLDAEKAAGLAVGDLVSLSFDEQGQLSSLEKVDMDKMGGPGGRGDFDPQGGGHGGPGGFGGNASASGTAANTAETDVSGETFASTASDENALKVSGSTVTLTDLTLEKIGDGSNTESCDFYGVNAGLLAADSAAVTVVGGSFTTDGAGANALFCYGSGTVLKAKNAVIRTSGRNSGGIQTAGGGTTEAENLDVETQGASAAAIRSDRGGGTVTVNGGSYVTHGTGSPAIYSTADITVSGAVLNATASEAVVVEGKNSVRLKECDVTGNMTGTYQGDSGENLQAVMIYQSMSGDASVGKGSFAMEGGSLTARAGDLFYVTNTKAEITLSGVQLNLSDNDILLRAAGNDGSRGWGAKGSNGGAVTVTASDQILTGTILVDGISSLDLTLSEGSAWTGTVNPEGAAGRVSLRLEDGCSWSLTGDAWLTAFDGDTAAIETNGFHVYVGGTLLV